MAIFTDADIQARALALQQQAQAKAAQEAEQQRQLVEQQAAQQAAERNRPRTWGEAASDTGVGLLQTAMNLGGAAYGAANLATLGGLDRLTGMSENFQQANQIAEGWKSAPLQARQQDVQAAFDQGVGAGVKELVTTPSVLGDYATQSLGYLLPGAAMARLGAAGGAARALAAGPALPETVATAAQQAATRAALATEAVQTGGYMNVDSINAARDAGLSEGEAQGRGLVGGAIGAVVGPALSKLTGAAGLEARAAQIGMGNAAPSAAQTVLQKAGLVGAGMTKEATEEGSQETYEQMVRNWAGNKALMQGTGQNAATGAVLGGLFGGVMAAAHLRSPSPARTQLDAAKAEITDTLAADTGESPLRPSFLDSLTPAPVLDPFAIDRKLATPPVLDTAALDAATAAPAMAVSPTGEVLQAQTDLLGDQTYPRAYDAPAVEPPVAAPTSRRQMGLDLAAPQAPISVDPSGTAIAPGADVPPLFNPDTISRKVLTPDEVPVLDTGALDSRLLQPADLPDVASVYQQFGPQAAAQEQVRRSAAAQQQADAQRTALLADEKAHRSAVRAALEQATGEKLAGQEVVKLAATLRNEGIAPTDPAFAPRVAELVNARLAENPDSKSKALGALYTAFTADPEPAAVDRAFARRGAGDTTEEAIFGPAPTMEGLDATSAERLKSLLASTGWDERGGQLRDEAGQAVGRTQWLSSQPEIQSVLTEYRSTPPEKAIELVNRALTGQGRPLTENQQNLVSDLVAALDDLRGGSQAPAEESIVEYMNRSAREDDAAASPLAQRIAAETGVRPSIVDMYVRDGSVRSGDLPSMVADFTAAYTAHEQRIDALAREEGARVRQQARDAIANGAEGVDLQEALEALGETGRTGRQSVGTAANASVNLRTAAANDRPAPARTAADYIAQLDTAQQTATNDAELEANVRAAIEAVRLDPDYVNLSDADWREVEGRIATLSNDVFGARFELSETVHRPRAVTSTAAFQRWFADSKIVDATGAPRVVYHGTTRDFVTFEGDYSFFALTAVPGEGSFEVNADTYAGRGEGANVMPVYLSIKNPKIMDALMGGLPMTTALDAARREGYDGAIIGGDEIVAFNPTQIKSAIGNAGGFDAGNSDITDRRRGGVAKPISTALFAKGVITAQSNVGRVHGFDTTVNLAAAVGFPVPATTKGMYHNGNIYLVRENLASGKDLAYTLAHEVGHGGLDQLLGDSLTAATNRMWANPAMRQRIKAKQAELDPGTTRAVAAEEVLADMLASGERLNKDVWAKLRAGVREFFARVFGLRGVTVTNAEVDSLLGDVARVIQGAPASSVRADMANPSLWFTDPVAAVSSEPKFAKVKTDLDKALSEASSETGGTVTSFSHFTEAAVQASTDGIKALLQAAKLGKVGEVYTRYLLHLNHMVALHDKALGGRISPIAKLKELQQALFNRTLAEEKARDFVAGSGTSAKTETLAKASINTTTETWDAFRRANPARGKLLDYALTEGTFYKLYPTLAWDQQPKVDYAKEGYTMGQRKAAYESVRKAYEQSGETGQALFKQSQAVYRDLFETRWNTYLDEVDRMGKLTEDVATDKDGHQQIITRIKDTIHKAMAAQRAGTYSPLQRYGKFLVTVRDSQGGTVFHAGYDSKTEAEAAAQEVLAARKDAGETDLKADVGIATDSSWSSVGVSAGTIEQLRRDAEAVVPVGLDAQTRAVVLNTISNGLVEAYLQALPVKSFMKHAIGRKNVAGYDGDALRGFANYTLRAARNIAAIKYDGQIDSALVQLDQYVKDVATGKYSEPGSQVVDTTKAREIASAVRAQHLAATSFQAGKFVSAAQGAGFMYFMTSPSQMFMNATQTLLVTLPRMLARYRKTAGEARTIREITRAMADYAKSRGNLLGEHSVLRRADASATDTLALAALERIRDDGPLDQSQAHDSAGIANGEAGALSPYWNKAMKWLSYAMHKSETFNRQVTALAAARLEQANQPAPTAGTPAYEQRREALVEAGKFWIDTTHFNYDKFNKPVALNTNTGALLGQFRQYQIHMLSMLAKDIRDAELGKLVTGKPPIGKEEAAIARRTLSYMLGTQLAFTGVAGTVLAPVAFAIMDAFRAMDDDEYLVDAKTETLAMMPTVAAYGLIGLGMDTSRISVNIIPFLDKRDYSPIGGKPEDALTYYVTQNLGPTFGLAKNLVAGTEAVVKGDFYKASQELLPKVASDAVKAVNEWQHGARDPRDVVYGQPSIWSGLNQLVGLKSAERRDLELPRNAAYQINQRAYQFKQQAQTRVALAQATGDMELYRETLDDVARFNAQYPDYRVKPQELVSAARSRTRAQGVAEATGVVSSRLPGPTLAPYLGR